MSVDKHPISIPSRKQIPHSLWQVCTTPYFARVLFVFLVFTEWFHVICFPRSPNPVPIILKSNDYAAPRVLHCRPRQSNVLRTNERPLWLFQNER